MEARQRARAVVLRARLYEQRRDDAASVTNRDSDGIDLKWFLTGPGGVTPGRTGWEGTKTSLIVI